MLEFDKPAFEIVMDQAVQLHNRQQYEAALALSTEAYGMAPLDSFEKGRAARDNSARNDRLGRHNEAAAWAREAYEVHDALVESMSQPTREAFRERAVSAMYVGVNGLRKVISARQAGQPADQPQEALQALRQTWVDLQAAKAQAQGVNRNVDQYEINAARRVSMAESLLGSKKLGLAIGARAIGLAFWSESPRLDTANPNLSTKQRIQTKAKAFLGGVAAVGIGLISISSYTQSRRLAANLAGKVL